MKPRLAIVVALGLAVGPVGPVAAVTDVEAKKFFNTQGCNGCHAVDEARIGPRFRDIANRYRAEREAALPRLAAKIRQGGAGNWGLVPMISNPRVTSDEARTIAAWILALPPGR